MERRLPSPWLTREGVTIARARKEGVVIARAYGKGKAVVGAYGGGVFSITEGIGQV